MHIHTDKTCDDCGARPDFRTCDDCGATALIVDCGHMAQPRPIAAGRADGSDTHKDFCGCCAHAFPSAVLYYIPDDSIDPIGDLFTWDELVDYLDAHDGPRRLRELADGRVVDADWNPAANCNPFVWAAVSEAVA